MAKVNTIVGLDIVRKNFKRRNKTLAAGTERGLKMAGLHLQREAQKLVPIDFGVLKASAFTRHTGSGYSTKVHVGFSAFYAIFVHENVEMKGKGYPRRPPSQGNYWDPAGRGQAKFLETPARRDRMKMRRIVQAYAKIVI
jgi:hypothetical protein